MRWCVSGSYIAYLLVTLSTATTTTSVGVSTSTDVDGGTFDSIHIFHGLGISGVFQEY